MNIFEAIKNNDIEGVKKALDMGVDVNQKNQWGDNALILAAKYGRKEIVQLLIDKGAKLDEKNNNGDTALILAAYYGRKEIVQLLIEKGANIDEKNSYGDTVLMYAIINRRIDSVKLLLDNGAKNIPNNKGKTPFKLAFKKRNKEILKLFLTHLIHDELVGD